MKLFSSWVFPPAFFSNFILAKKLWFWTYENVKNFVFLLFHIFKTCLKNKHWNFFHYCRSFVKNHFLKGTCRVMEIIFEFGMWNHAYTNFLTFSHAQMTYIVYTFYLTVYWNVFGFNISAILLPKWRNFRIFHFRKTTYLPFF